MIKSCNISNTGGVVSVFNTDGSFSELYKEALEYTGNVNEAVQLWAHTQTMLWDELMDSKENVSLQDVFRFVDNLPLLEQTPPTLSEREISSIKDIMYRLDIENLSDLTNKFNNLFMSDGFFKISRSKLLKSGLYTNDEINALNIKELKDFIARVNIYNSQNSINVAINPIKTSLKFKNIDSDTNLLGFKNLLTIEEIALEVADLTDDFSKKSVENVLADTEFSNGLESPTFIKNIVNFLSDKKKVFNFYPNGTRTSTIVSNTLRADVDLVSLDENISFLESINENVWEANSDKIRVILKNVEQNALDNGLDLIGISDNFSSKEDIVNLLSSVVQMVENPTEDNIIAFSDFKDLLIPQGREYKLEKRTDGLTIVNVSHNNTQDELFSEQGLIKVGSGLYHQIDNSYTKEELQEEAYNRVLAGELIIDAKYYNTTEINLNDPLNKQEVLEAIDRWISSRDIGVDAPLNGDMISYYQVLFNHTPLEKDSYQELSNEFSESYLKDNFVADFYQYYLQEKFKNSELFKKKLQYFSVLDGELEYNHPTNDIIDLDGLRYEKELVEYAKLKKEGQIKSFAPDSDYVSEDVKILNNPNEASQIESGDFIVSDDYLITKGVNNNNYLNQGNKLYRKLFSNQGGSIYKEVNIKTDNIYNDLDTTFTYNEEEVLRKLKQATDNFTPFQAKPANELTKDIKTDNEIKEVLDQLMKTNLAKGYEIMSSEEIRNKLIELGVDADVAFQISAWHGTPHKFDRFSTEFMGSGEGNQAFGWGLYFTDLESIARNYANELSTIKSITGVPKNIEEDILFFLNNYLSDENNVENIVDLRNAISLINQKFIRSNTDVKLINRTKTLLDFLNKNIRNEDIKIKKNKNLYKVTLHKGKQPSEYTWLEWDKPLTSEQKELLFNSVSDSSLSGLFHNIKISDRFDADSFDGGKTYRVGDTSKMGQEDEFTSTIYSTLEEAEVEVLRLNRLDTKATGKDFSESLAKEMGEKQASLFLLENGIDGIKYPAESVSRGATSDNARGFNYVVFDENAVTIEEIIQFQKEGVTLLPNGFYHNGKVYINRDLADLSTPIHEFSHSYNQLLKNEKPEFYQEGLRLIEKEGQQYVDFVKKNQPNLQGEALLEEALAQAVGDAGVKLIETEKSKGLKQWLQNAWNNIKQMLGLSSYTIEQVRNMSLQEYTNAVAVDLLRGEEVNFKTPSEEYFERNADRLPLTLSVFNRPEFKGMQGKMVNPITVLNSLNQSGIKQIEKDLIKQIIQGNYQGQKKISYDELEATVRANIMPLERIFTSSYADYGMDNLGNGNYGEANTIILNAPIEHGVTGHFSGDFKVSGRKNIKYVPKQLNDNTWVAVEEGYESQANDNNIYQYVGTAGTKEAVESWIVKYDLSQGKIFDNKKYLVYQDAFDQKDNVIPVEGFNTEQEAKNFIEKNKDNFSYNLDYVDENYIKEKWNLEDTNKGMFGHIRVWQDGQTFYVSELQSDYFQKNNARRNLLDKMEKNNPFIKKIKEIENNISDAYLKYKKEVSDKIKNQAKKIQAVEIVKIEDVLTFFENFGVNISVGQERVLNVSPKGTKYVVFDTLSTGLRNPIAFTESIEEAKNIKAEQEKILLKDYTKDEIYNGVSTIIERNRIETKIKEDTQSKEEFINDNFKKESVEIKKLQNQAEQYSLKNLSPQEKQFIASQKEWEKRMVREAIKEASLSGATSLRFPTPYTLSVIEGYLEPSKLQGAELGGIVDYLDREYVVVDDTGDELTIIPLGNMQKVNIQEFEDMQSNGDIEEGVDIYEYYLGDIGYGVEDINGEYFYYNRSYRPDGLERISSKDAENKGKDDFSIEDSLNDTQQTVARKYEEIAEILKAERGDNFEVITDENGFDWYETKLATEEINNSVIAFQIISSETNDIRYQIDRNLKGTNTKIDTFNQANNIGLEILPNLSKINEVREDYDTCRI